MLLLTSKSTVPLANAAAAGSHNNKRSGIGSFLPIPKGLITYA
jgi:hypothetical protein